MSTSAATSTTPVAPKGHTVGYIRVSSLDQNSARQLDGIHTDKTFTDKAVLPQPLAALQVGKSYLNCQQDAALPHSLGWHPRLSERLGLFRLVECPGSHEAWFTNPGVLREAIIAAGRD